MKTSTIIRSQMSNKQYREFVANLKKEGFERFPKAGCHMERGSKWVNFDKGNKRVIIEFGSY